MMCLALFKRMTVPLPLCVASVLSNMVPVWLLPVYLEGVFL